MPQNVMVSVIGEGEYMPKMVRAILSREVIPSRNLLFRLKIKQPVRRPRVTQFPSVRMIFPR